MFSGVIATRVETKQSSAANKRGQRNGCVQAIYDYVPQYEAELALHLGDIIEDVVENEDGWWSGDLHGRLGIFPSNYVKRLYPFEMSVRAEWDYDGSVESPPFKELLFRQGDVFIVDDKDIESNGEWWHGMKMTTKGTVEEGWFPSRFVQPVNTGLTALAPKPPSAASKTIRKKEKLTNTTKEDKAADAAGHVFVTITAGYNLKKKPAKKMTAQAHIGILEGEPRKLRSIYYTKEIKGDNDPAWNEHFQLNVKEVGRSVVYIVVRDGKKSLGSIEIPVEEQMCGGYSKEEQVTGRVMKLQGKDANGTIKVVAKYSSYMSKPTSFKKEAHMGFAETTSITWEKILEMSGLSPADLKDPKTALIVQQVLGQYKAKGTPTAPPPAPGNKPFIPQLQGGTSTATTSPPTQRPSQQPQQQPPPAPSPESKYVRGPAPIKPPVPINGVRGSKIVPRDLKRSAPRKPPQRPAGPPPSSNSTGINTRLAGSPPSSNSTGLNTRPAGGPPSSNPPAIPGTVPPRPVRPTPPTGSPPSQQSQQQPQHHSPLPQIEVNEYGPPPALPPRPEDEDYDEDYIPPPVAPRRTNNLLSLSGKKLSEEEQKKKAERERLEKEKRLQEQREREAERVRWEREQAELLERERREQEEWERLAREEQDRLAHEEAEREREEYERYEREQSAPPPLPERDPIPPPPLPREPAPIVEMQESAFMVSLREQREKLRQQAAEKAKKEKEEGQLALPQVNTMEEANSLADMIRNAMTKREQYLKQSDSEEETPEWDLMASTRGY